MNVVWPRPGLEIRVQQNAPCIRCVHFLRFGHRVAQIMASFKADSRSVLGSIDAGQSLLGASQYSRHRRQFWRRYIHQGGAGCDLAEAEPQAPGAESGADSKLRANKMLHVANLGLFFSSRDVA